jgi:hypothetical protein
LHHCKEQDLKICAILLETETCNLLIISLYRAPFGDFNQFLKRLGTTLKYLYNPKSEFLICGDMNIDYLNESNQEKTNSLLTTYNLTLTVNFASRIQNGSSTVVDNIFVDSIRLSPSSVSPIINGLSGHDAQLLTINNIASAVNLIPLKQRTRKINNDTIMQFQLLLMSETWESVYRDQDINNRFHSFLYTALNIFEASFPIKYESMGKIKNDWVTQGIKISCKSKRCLIHSRNSNDPNTRAFYIKYCKILNNVIKEAKKQHYSRLIAKQDNKIKTTWNLIRWEKYI